MKKIFFSFFIIILAISFVYPQSLAEIAKKERERRKKIKKHVPIITNKTLGKIKKGKGYGFIISTNTGSISSTHFTTETSNKEGDFQANPINYQDWSDRYKELLMKIKEAEDFFNKKKKELDNLIFRFKITNNPNEKYSLPQKISQKEKEVAKANNNLKKLKKELEDFKEKARKAGVPPGYIR